MTPARFAQITDRYAGLRVGVLGDFCLDRYLEIDPARQEISIETGLPVHNVVRVRAQPGGAGTIVNNLSALGIGVIHVIGFCGDDGEGYELRRALACLPGVCMERFLTTPLRRTFTYCKPLLVKAGQTPVELNRLDSKNWTPTPEELQGEVVRQLHEAAPHLDALIVLEQVDLPETGVITRGVRDAIAEWAARRAELPIVADSRRGLRGFPPVCFKMNRTELAALLDRTAGSLAEVKRLATELARTNGRHVFVTLADEGIVGAAPGGEVVHALALPLRGPIDVVGAGDCVTANITAALAAGASPRETLELANAAASIVIHQLGATGTARVDEILQCICPSAALP